MMQEQFQKWIPVDNLGSAYDIEDISWGCEISFTLIADKKRITQDNIHCFKITWDSSNIISCNITDETYRADCWELDFENNGRFYTSKNSNYVESFKQKSPLCPDDAIHFLIIGTNTIVDILAKEYPMVRVLEDSRVKI